MSDLHTEFGLSSVLAQLKPVSSDLLVLAGDIAIRGESEYALQTILDRLGPPAYLYIPGNHEYYGTGADPHAPPAKSTTHTVGLSSRPAHSGIPTSPSLGNRTG